MILLNSKTYSTLILVIKITLKLVKHSPDKSLLKMATVFCITSDQTNSKHLGNMPNITYN